MAGGVSGNLSGLFKMIVFNAGTYSRPYCVEEAMKLFLVSNDGYVMKNKAYWEGRDDKSLYILESFIYAKKSAWLHELIPKFKGFMLDSGAFTYMQGNGGKVDWDQYIEEYSAYIIKHNIELFFELDIDVIVGINEVERLRSKLEQLTGRQCIPVWHRGRGREYWLRMIEQYKYVAIGGIVSGEIKEKDFPVFNWFLKTAREKGCKVHGLGFTNLDGLRLYKFHSVDSTAWLYGNRGGFLYKLTDGNMEKIDVPEGMRLKAREVAIHNFNEWVKFQKYAEVNL